MDRVKLTVFNGRLPMVVYYGLSFCVVLFGVLVLIGLYTHNTALIQIAPQYAPMQYGTALGFVVSGFGLLLLRKFKKAAFSLGIIVLLLSLLTLFQYVFNSNIGVGRMGISTGLCFGLVGLVLILTSLFKSNKHWLRIPFVLSLLVLILGVQSLINGLLEFNTLSGVNDFAYMSLHGAIGFIIISGLMLLSLWRYSHLNLHNAGWFLPAVVFVVGAILFSVLWNSLSLRESARTAHFFQKEGQLVSEHTANTLSKDIDLMHRMIIAQHRGSYVSINHLKHDANSYVNYLPSLEALAFNLASRNKVVVTKNHNIGQEELNALVKQCQAVVLSHSNRIRQDMFSGVVGSHFCVGGENAQNLAVINLNWLMKSVLNNTQFQNLSVQILEGDKVLYSSTGIHKSKLSQVRNKYKIKALGLDWKIILVPTRAYVSNVMSKLPGVLLIIGLLGSLLLAMILRFWLMVSARHYAQKEKVLSQKVCKQSFKKVADTSPYAVLLLDELGQVVSLNKQAESLWEYSASELMNQKMSKLLSRQSKACWESQFNKALENTEEQSLEALKDVLLLQKSTAEIPVEIFFALFQIEGHMHVLCTVIDMRQYKDFEDRIQQYTRNIKLINDTMALAVQKGQTDEALQLFLDLICQSLNWPVGHIYMIHETKHHLESSGIWFLKHPDKSVNFKSVTTDMSFKKGVGLPGRIWATKEPAWIENVFDDNNFPRAKVCRDVEVSGAVGFPIIVHGKVIAVLEFFAYESRERDDGLLQTFEIMGEQIGHIFERNTQGEKDEAKDDD